MEQHLEKELGLTPNLNKYFEAIPDESVLTPEDVAQLLQRSTETIRRWCRTGKLTCYGFGGKYTILGNDFKQFMVENQSRRTKTKKVSI